MIARKRCSRILVNLIKIQDDVAFEREAKDDEQLQIEPNKEWDDLLSNLAQFVDEYITKINNLRK